MVSVFALLPAVDLPVEWPVGVVWVGEIVGQMPNSNVVRAVARIAVLGVASEEHPRAAAPRGRCGDQGGLACWVQLWHRRCGRIGPRRRPRMVAPG